MSWSEILRWQAKQQNQGRERVLPAILVQAASVETPELFYNLKSTTKGLNPTEVSLRLLKFGRNEVAAERKINPLVRLWGNFKDPLSILLFILGIIAYLAGDIKTTSLIVVMLFLSVTLRWWQELKADRAVEKLKAMVRITATVVRGGKEIEVPLKHIVPGDVVHLSAGDMVPADLRLIESRDLFINQATLTGESLPAEKHAPKVDVSKYDNQFDLPNICFMGTDVVSGTAYGLVLATGQKTYFGALAQELGYEKEVTGFDKGIENLTWIMIRLIAIMVPLVLIINGVGKGNWLDAFLFALAVAVGLAPEMLPMIVTVNLSKGAIAMSKKKVIVKRLNAIQNFGAMDILCTDKTGTLTEGKVALIKYLDIVGHENKLILNYAYINSFYQTGLKNLLDVAVLQHPEVAGKKIEEAYKKVDELPFDFVRRRMSVVVEDKHGRHLLLCKGAVEEIIKCSTRVQVGSELIKLTKAHLTSHESMINDLSGEGFRLIALAYREVPQAKRVYKVTDETDLILLGFLAFLDPPKKTSKGVISLLAKNGVGIKVLTGDNQLVARKVCQEVGININSMLSGSELGDLSQGRLINMVDEVTVFYKLEPAQKEIVIKALQKRGHVVGYLGDGINDALALKSADVGISVDGAHDIAKESSDIILLEKSLLVLKDGVREGRKVFGNIEKYIEMATSSNFGNMFSVVGASIFLPFLPMLPLQVITNNLLYDLSQVTIPTDEVDEEYLIKPRRWEIDRLQRFIFYLGPLSSIFDYATFGLLIFLFSALTNPALFQTGWFVESLISQTIIIHAIRTNKWPFIKSRASWPLIISTILIILVGCWLPYSPLVSVLGFIPLPINYWLWLILLLVTYFILAHLVKRWFAKQFRGI